MNDKPADPIRLLAEEYREMNGTHVQVLPGPPSALEFARLVHISRPVLIKRMQVPAVNLWTDKYLIKKLGTQTISVAVTPDGRADAIHKGPDGLDYFVEPLVETMSMENLLKQINSSDHGDIYYLQSQNGNLFSAGDEEGGTASEFDLLRSDVVSEIDWCSEALGRQPEAVNIWIGNSKSVTSIHSDPYENIYLVVRGEKRFTLIPPTDGWSLKERFYPHAQFTRSTPSGKLEITPSPVDTPQVRWSSLPDHSLSESLPAEVKPIHITVRPGEAMYLPVGWWHHVEQSDETTIALNWWYDAESQGLQWAVLRTLREVEHVSHANNNED